MKIKTYFYIPAVKRVFRKREFERICKDKPVSLSINDYVPIPATSLDHAERLACDLGFSIHSRVL